MPFNPLRNEIDKIHLAKTGKTSEQIHSDILSSEREVAAITAMQTPTIPIQEKLLEDSLGKFLSVDSALSTSIAGKLQGTEGIAKISNENQLGDVKGLSASSEITKAVSIFQKALKDGSLDESRNVMDELYEKFNEASQKLEGKPLADLQKVYADIISTARTYNSVKLAKTSLDPFFAESTPQQKQAVLNSLGKTKDAVYNLRGPNSNPKQIIEYLADLDSKQFGSKLYNQDDLELYKTGQVQSDKISSELELNYNNAQVSALRDKELEFTKSIADLDAQIKLASGQNKEQLLNQKAAVQQDLKLAKDLQAKLTPFTNEDKYLKQFYPTLHTEKVNKERAEVLRNQAGTGFIDVLASNVKYTGSNLVKTAAGIADLVGSDATGFNLRQKAESIAPPSFFAGSDLNKNNKLDEFEIKKDIHGNKVSLNQWRYQNPNGEYTYNWAAPFEQVLPIATDVAATILLSRAVGKAARSTTFSWTNIAAKSGMNTEQTAFFLKSVAPRISTFGNVAATTFPRFYAEEKSNFKNSDDARSVALGRAFVEALSETIIPETEFFKAGAVGGPLDPIFKKIGDKIPVDFTKLTAKRDLLMGLLPNNAISSFNAALLVAPSLVRKTLSGATQESIEELGSLFGNHFIDKYAATKNFEVQQDNELNWDNALSTFVEGFIPSLFISGMQSAAPYKVKVGKESQWRTPYMDRRDQARWDIANNAETYKAFVNKKFQDNKISPEERIKQLAAIDNLSNRLESMKDIANIKDLSNLLDDRESQVSFFNNVLFQEDLLTVDPTTLTPEELKSYEDSLQSTSNILLSLKNKADKYAGLTEPEKQQILSDQFNKKANAVENPNTSLSDLLAVATQTQDVISRVPEGDSRYEFLTGEYNKFQERVNATIADRIDGFQQLLEENPQQVTLLELQLAKDSFLPILQDLEQKSTVPVGPQQEETRPFSLVNTPQLIQDIETELSTRTVLTEEESARETRANLNNPETRDIQSQLMALAELSQEELESGELEADKHNHLSPAQLLRLGIALEQHSAQKEESPETPTILEQQREYSLTNSYKLAISGLDAINAREKVIEMNKAVLSNEEPVTSSSSFQPASTKTEEPVAAAVTNIPGERLSVDQDIYNTFAQYLADANVGLNNPDFDDEQAKRFFGGVIRDLVTKLGDFKTLNEVRSALLGFFPTYINQIESTFDLASQGTVDVSALPFGPKQKQKIFDLLTTLVNNNQITPDATTTTTEDGKVDEVLDTPTDEDTTATDNFDLAQDIQSQEIQSAEYTGKGLRLNMVSLGKDNKSIDDFPVTLSYSILEAYSTNKRSGKATDLNVRIQSMMGIYEFVLSPAAVQGLKELQSKTSLTDEEKDLLVGYFTVNGKLIHDAGFINYVKEKPSAIGTGVGTTFVDSKGDLLSFTGKGQPSKSKKSFVSINVLPRDKADVATTQIRTLAESGKIITSEIIDIAPGMDKPMPLSSITDETIYVHTDSITLEEEGVGKSYFVRPGSVHVVNEDARNKYTGVIIPTNGDSIQAFVTAFNEGTLPKELDESIRTNATEFLNYISRQINSTRVKVDPEKSKLAIRYFKNASLYLSSTNDNKIVVKSKPNKNLLKTKNQEEDLRKLGEKSYKLVDARLLKDNKPFTALVVSGTTVVAKQYNSYTDYVKSPEFGAFVKREENRKLVFSSNYRVLESEVDVTNDNVEVIDLVENIPAQPTVSKQLDLLTDQPRLTPQQVASREAEEARQREVERADAIAKEQLYREYLQEKEAFKTLGLTPEGMALEGNRISRDSFVKFADKANLQGREGKAIGFAYLGKRGEGVGVDEVARIASGISDTEVTAQDIIDFILTYPGGIGGPTSMSDTTYFGRSNPDINPRYAEIKSLIKEVEGPKKLTRRPTLYEDSSEDSLISPDFFFRTKTLSNSVTGKQNALAKAWVANHPIFKNTSFIFNETISHPEAYAVWSKAGIFLYEGANYAEAYHEAWHEFSQLYLTPGQKESLYAQARVIYGELPFVELEEKLAEDFRAYALSMGKTLPENIKKNKDAKSIFSKIWDFITNLFTNKKTVDHYFGRLYKGNLSQFKRNEANAYFKTLYSGKFTYYDQDGKPNSLSFRDSKALLDDVDSLYTYVANNVFKGRGQSFVNIVATAKNANSVYPYVGQYLEGRYNELLEEYNKTQNVDLVPQIDSIVDMYDRFGSIVQYHKQNSTLFDDKIKKELVTTQVEELEKANTEFATFESSVNEISQKQLASQVLINALKTLPKYENGVEVLHPVFGIPVIGSFTTNWNILQRKLSGSNSYADLYSRVEDLTEDYPQFSQFLEYLPAANAAIKLTSSMNFKNEFNRIFSMPYIEGYTTEIKRNEEGEISEVRVFQAQSLDSKNIRDSYDTQFALNLTSYSLVNTELGTFYLNTEKYFNNFPGVPAVPKDEEDHREYNQGLYDMLKPLGFKLSPNSVELFIDEDANVQSRRLNLIYNKLKSLSETKKYITTPLASLSTEHTIEIDGSVKKIGGENSSVSSIIQYEVDANPQYVNDMRYNAAQKQIWSVNQHTYMTKVVSVLNDDKLYPTLDDVIKEFPHLDPENNPNVRGSFILSYLFNSAGKRTSDKVFGKETLRQVELGNLLGIKELNEGEKTIDSKESQKHFADIVGFVKSGIEEINRLSGKATTRGLVLDNRLREYLKFTVSENETDPFAVSGTPQIPYSFFKERILPLINAEVANTVKGSANFTIKPIDEDGSPKLAYFHKIFSSEQRNALLSAYKVSDSTKSLSDVFESIPQAKEIFNAFRAYISEQANYSEEVLGNEYPVSKTDLLKYHFFSFVSRIEQHKIFFGHPYYYKNAKDIEKRLSMWNAFGSYPTLDNQNLDFLNSSESGLTMQSQREAYQAYASKEGIKVNPNRANVDQISYLVLEDEPVNSLTAKASKFYGKNKQAYVDNTAAAKQDAAAFCTLDFFRKFYSLSTGITFEMSQEFKRQDNIYKKYLELQSAQDYQVAAITEELEAELNKGPFYKFTIKKLQYAGHNKIESGESVPVGHKYSMKPILPSEIIADPALASILGKLHASSADYAVYKSGTKLSETVESVSLFNAKGEVQDEAVPVGLIDLKNLKEQVLVENKDDFNSIFSTQFRKLVYKDVRTEEGMKLYNAYKGIIESLTGFDKLKFLEQLDNKEKLVEMLIREMSRKNVSESTKDLVKLKEDGSLMHNLDSMIDRTIMESAIVSSVKNAIIRQKLPGAQRVQYPVSLIRPSRKLRFYDIVEGKVSKAEAIVSFSKGYYPLLNLVSPVDRQPIGKLNAEGNPIDPYTALTRLNEAINNPRFRRTYANQLAMVAIRVPGQGYNSMENFEIVEFLPEESGEIILVPDEMVVKSGSDYDIDKLFCYDPTIARNGTMSTTQRTPEESIAIKNDLLSRLKENKELFREILDEKKALTQELGEILQKRGFDPKTRVAQLYEELKSYKHADENELADSGVITEADLLKLKERLEKGVETEKSQKVNTINTRISKLRAALSEIYDADLSAELADINEELSSLSNETNEIKDQLKTLRGNYSNALLLNISERLSQAEIFNDLITPNEISSIAQAVTDFGDLDERKMASLTNIVSPLYQLYVFSLNTYKTSLGTDAKNNVFHSMLQKTTFYREDELGTRNYLLDSNRTSEGYINFSKINDVDGERISYLSGQMISAHVDIEKNDGIARINLNNVVTPIVNYVLMAGTRFNDIVKLINMTPSIISYSKGKDLTSILDIIRGNTPQGNVVIDLLKQSEDKYGNYSRSKLKNIVFKHLFGNVERTTAAKLLLTEEGPLGELRRFVQFLELEDQARDLATVSLSTDYDTFSPQNFESFRSNVIDLIPYLKETGDKSKIFNKKGLGDIISNTVVSPFQIQQEVLDKFVEVFPVSANSALTNKILSEFAKVKEVNRRLDYDKFSRTFKNDLLYTLFINNVSEAAKFETYVDKTNPGNIGAMFINLKARLKTRGIEADNIMFDIMTVSTDKNSKYIRTGVLDTDLDYSVDMYKEAFEQGFNWSNPALDPSIEADADLIGDMQGFFKAFAYAGIIGSQLNKRFDSYLPLIPESIYTLPMTDVVNKFSSELDSMLATLGESGFLTDFVKRFNENHPEFRKAVQPVSLGYYKDYVLSRANSVDLTAINIEELNKDQSAQPLASNALAEQLTLEFEIETKSLLEDSFASLRKLNSELSKNC